jgi:lycopene beta-cyclase
MTPLRADTEDPERIVILGGGLAGLSLAVQLVRHGVQRPITILEPRETYTDDRTWCFWETEAHPFADAVAQRWHGWRVTAGERTAVAESARYPYCRLPAAAFYDAALALLNEAPQVTLRRGVAVRDVWRETGGRLAVVTDEPAVYTAALAFDGRPPSAGSWPLQGHPFLWQDFLGWRVQARPGSFDPEAVTLMDFDHAPEDGLRFLYVLPYSDREALLETTAFTQAPPDKADHARHLEAALAALCRGPAAIAGSERGRIPMTSAPPPPPVWADMIPIGTRAGAPRGSTGYAFLAIQRHADAVAARVAAGRSPAVPLRSTWTRWLDRVFLTRLLADPAGAPELFYRMFARVEGDRMVRFLSERGGLHDHLSVMSALPVAPFLRAAMASLPRLQKVSTA